MRKTLKSKKWVGLIGVLCSIFVIFLILLKIEVKVTIEELSKLNVFYFIFLSGIYLMTFFLRAFRWKLMLNNSNVNYSLCLEGIVIGFAGNNVIPARGGELLRMEFFSKKTGINRVTTISSVFGEKILDGVSLILFMLLGIYLAKENLLEVLWLRKLFISINIIFSSFIGLIFISKIFRARIGLFFKTHRSKYLRLVGNGFQKITEGLDFFEINFNTFLIMQIGLIIWLLEGSMFMIGLYFLGVEVDFFPVGLIILSIVNFGLLVPSSPGFIGVFQAMTILGLSMFGVSNESALSLGVLIHAAQYIPITIWGIIILLKSTVFVNLHSHQK
ncbi:lysylphosphatidylglycerol synthase transmembrane domain-containing protein [Flexithrix dorotheae]|uniref:lysylphosphatidylglycerol synthase transmembrane domain-containing protein n=1 Tax=Flexithrix dorotheae TaxID=70993 RepID=UPI00037100C0|nr:lysylphosphatidylglycerol synthase transmembrane domain-containing protein [Flexithrix dorotheae]